MSLRLAERATASMASLSSSYNNNNNNSNQKKKNINQHKHKKAYTLRCSRPWSRKSKHDDYRFGTLSASFNNNFDTNNDNDNETNDNNNDNEFLRHRETLDEIFASEVKDFDSNNLKNDSSNINRNNRNISVSDYDSIFDIDPPYTTTPSTDDNTNNNNNKYDGIANFNDTHNDMYSDNSSEESIITTSNTMTPQARSG